MRNKLLSNICAKLVIDLEFCQSFQVHLLILYRPNELRFTSRAMIPMMWLPKLWPVKSIKSGMLMMHRPANHSLSSATFIFIQQHISMLEAWNKCFNYAKLITTPRACRPYWPTQCNWFMFKPRLNRSTSKTPSIFEISVKRGMTEKYSPKLYWPQSMTTETGEFCEEITKQNQVDIH